VIVVVISIFEDNDLRVLNGNFLGEKVVEEVIERNVMKMLLI